MISEYSFYDFENEFETFATSIPEDLICDCERCRQ